MCSRYDLAPARFVAAPAGPGDFLRAFTPGSRTASAQDYYLPLLPGLKT